jgi:hypothetical protein
MGLRSGKERVTQAPVLSHRLPNSSSCPADPVVDSNTSSANIENPTADSNSSGSVTPISNLETLAVAGLVTLGQSSSEAFRDPPTRLPQPPTIPILDPSEVVDIDDFDVNELPEPSRRSNRLPKPTPKAPRRADWEGEVDRMALEMESPPPPKKSEETN